MSVCSSIIVREGRKRETNHGFRRIYRGSSKIFVIIIIIFVGFHCFGKFVEITSNRLSENLSLSSSPFLLDFIRKKKRCIA